MLREFQPDVAHVTIFLTQLSPLILPLLRDVPSLYYAVWYRIICPLGTKMLPDGTDCTVPAGYVCYQNDCLPLRDWMPLQMQSKMVAKWRNVFRAVAANSDAVRTALVSAGWTDVDIIWPGVAERELRDPAKLSGTPVVAFAGRLVKEKGAEVLLRAFARIRPQVPDAQLWILGDGPDRAKLESVASAPGLEGSVIFTGRLNHLEMERRLEQVWVQVVPSLWPEPFGVVATEAMMRGTAVIASDCGGLREIVSNDVSGYLAPPGNEAALSALLLKMLTDRNLCKDMGNEGHRIAVEKFAERTSIDRFIARHTRMVKKA